MRNKKQLETIHPQSTIGYSDYGTDLFSDEVMKQKLSDEAYSALRKIIDEGGSMTIELAGEVAEAMLQWALEKGATHYTHWFQPMTGSTAEKRNAFLEFSELNKVPIVDFSAKALIRGEADGSSFPTGGLRLVFEARGYTTWDCTSPAFIKRDATGTACLCIPTAFCAFSGVALDEKTPLLRSMQAVEKQAIRVIRALGQDAKRVIPCVGSEQEYFLIDRKAFLKRKDLVYTGRTLFGAPPSKGQELSDQYYAATPERVIEFMDDLNQTLWRMGVPAITEHNEVAPSQYELAPVFVSANLAVDHNQLTMECMRRVAERHGMVCLLHEKPFAQVNGSGKHNNWSLVTDSGVNLLKPTRDPSWSRIFYTFLLATICAVDEYAGLLRWSCSSVGNEYRLGGYEAPTPILSVFIGETLQAELEHICLGGDIGDHKQNTMDIGVSTLASLRKDDDDRNRTSPFAFTGNKFEFRMVGSSQSIGLPNTVLNTIVAEYLMRIADQLDQNNSEDTWSHLMSNLYTTHRRVIFNGNAYDPSWKAEALRRQLPNIDNNVDAILVTKGKEAHELFVRHAVFNEAELSARSEISLQNYATTGKIEAITMLKISRQTILPRVISFASDLSETMIRQKTLGLVSPQQMDLLNRINALIEQSLACIHSLEAAVESMPDTEESAQSSAMIFRDAVREKMEDLRQHIDALERIVGKDYWPQPSYGEMLFRIN